MAGVLGVVLLLTVAGAQAQSPPNVVSAQLQLFPQVAAPGDTVWIGGSLKGMKSEEGVQMGGQRTSYSTELISGWLRFRVPKSVGGGPQEVEFTDTSALSKLIFNVLPPESASQQALVYAEPSRIAELGKIYCNRLEDLLAGCQKACPPELTATIKRPSTLNFSQLKLTPLAPARTSNRDVQAASPRMSVPALPPPVTSRLLLRLATLIRPFPSGPFQKDFCGQLAGLLPTAGLPTGQVIALLDALFGQAMGIDR